VTLEALQTLGQTLEQWQEEIGRMLRFSRSNGITEGFHTKMEMISEEPSGLETSRITETGSLLTAVGMGYLRSEINCPRDTAPSDGVEPLLAPSYQSKR